MFLLIDKPKGITSHDVIDEVRKITGEKKVGHAGTLDPNATGLLIVGVGRESTKRLGKIAIGTKKTYESEIYLGEERDTDDSEGKVIKIWRIPQQVRSSQVAKSARDDKAGIKSLPALSKAKIEEILKTFVGEQEQIPPKYSSIKIKGKKAYELARKGEKVDLKPRKITIYSIKLVSYKFPSLKIETTVSSGTYVRALARDIGKRLGSGAYLKNLRRTKIGDYSIDQAIRLRSLSKFNWKSETVNIE
ncbi:tRNA pseudouridine(55) synthase TruB [Patescibacteria group bacterium]|nr:tRNA pseudouridine(55) synthase TruB [Patescibacteria group bacterium]